MTNYHIERLGHQGDGIAAGPVYAPRTLPDEDVTGVLDGDTLEQIKIVTPSDHRIKAPCRHYNSCGGCALQHASDEFVSGWKQGIVQNALAAHGIDFPVGAIHTSPPNSRRRAKLSGRRTKSGAIVGFHGRASGTIVATPDCTVLNPDILAALPLLEAITAKVGSRKGEVQFQVTATVNGLDLNVLDARALSASEQAEMAQLTRRYGVARLTWSDELIAGEKPAGILMGDTEVVPPAGAFLQATPQGQAALTSFVMKYAEGAGKSVDLFSGCGTFSFPLATVSEVHAVEGDEAMLAALDQGWRMAKGLKSISTECRDLFRRPMMADELRKFDLAVIDPPRAGAEAQITHLTQSAVNRVVMISCNPVTFARDAATLVAAGFVLEALDVVDQFRWSSHIEIASAFRR